MVLRLVLFPSRQSVQNQLELGAVAWISREQLQ